MTDFRPREDFGNAFMFATAGAAGCTVCPGREGSRTDLLIEKQVRLSYVVDATVRVQMKTWDSPVRTRDGLTLRYKVEAGLYDVLRDERRYPDYLVVVHVPKAEAQWVAPTAQNLLCSHAAYWIDLVRWPALKPGRKTVTVDIPTNQLLTPGVVDGWMTKAARRTLAGVP